MPRPRRFEVPGTTLHVVQRGNNRCACFFGDVDRRFYLKCLAEAAARRDVAVHAYVLMTNHVHLLLTPSASGAVALALQDIGRKYVRIFNAVHGRSGTLWEGRYKSSAVTDERYLLACHRYIELNPVRAGLVSDPADYPWSSYRRYAYGHTNSFVIEHAAYTALANTPSGRCQTFRTLCSEGTPLETLQAIREAINANCELGLEVRRRGRPRKIQAAEAPEPQKLF